MPMKIPVFVRAGAYNNVLALPVSEGHSALLLLFYSALRA